MEIFGFRKLIAYQRAKELVKHVYSIVYGFPKEERYALSDQMRRAVISVTSNIAEGVNRYSLKDKIHFLEISYGSLMEVASHCEMAEEIGYISKEQRMNVDNLVEEIARLISGLQASYKEKMDNNLSTIRSK
ncbi:MAG: four helix bundle protein [Bacteroidales bacterium]|nr:four helix bundle protein [Bacteroidales bacterium]